MLQRADCKQDAITKVCGQWGIALCDLSMKSANARHETMIHVHRDYSASERWAEEQRQPSINVGLPQTYDIYHSIAPVSRVVSVLRNDFRGWGMLQSLIHPKQDV